jgi:hypothetical protein
MTITSENDANLLEYPVRRPAVDMYSPAPELKQKQEQGPLHKVRLRDGSTAWLVTRYADQRQAFRDTGISASPLSPGYPKQTEMTDEEAGSAGFILMDEPDHTRLRRMVTAPFGVKKVQAMRPGIQKIVDEKLDEILAGPKPIDLYDQFALHVPSLVICQLLGVPYEDHDFFQAESMKIVDLRDEERRREGMMNLGGYLYQLLEKKQAEPADDLLSGLAEFVKSGEIDPIGATTTAVLLLFAGHETTANMIALGTLALLDHPDQLALLRDSDDPELFASAVEELLRYLTIIHIGSRRAATEDVEIAGQVIKAGEGVILPLDLSNRDPEIFENPDELDLTRNFKNHLSFAFGPHQCLGLPLARLELEVVFSTLFKRIPELRLATTRDTITFKEEGAVYGIAKLPVTW